MIHQPTLTPAEFRRTPLWQSIAPAIAQANSGAALDTQCAIASRRIVEQAGPNVGVGLVELEFKRSLTHLAWANARIYPWRIAVGLMTPDESVFCVAIGHIETDDARIIGLYPKTGLSAAIHRAERTLIIQGSRLDLWIITAPPNDYRLKRFINECNPPPKPHELNHLTLHRTA